MRRLDWDCVVEVVDSVAECVDAVVGSWDCAF